MTSKSTTPSEGEIVESDSEKATTSLPSAISISVDRHSRNRVSVSRSPSPIRSPRRYSSRSRSRSPYREPRGAKRAREDDYINDYNRGDRRRFKIHHEERMQERSRNNSFYNDLDRESAPDSRIRYDDRGSYGRPRDKRQRTRSRSPPRFHNKTLINAKSSQGSRDLRPDGFPAADRGYKGEQESRGRLPKEQSVSDRGNTPIAAAFSNRNTETQSNQTRPGKVSSSGSSHARDKSNSQGLSIPQKSEEGLLDKTPVNEATLIEERRKRREAIKAKYRGQATPLLVKALAINHESTSPPPKTETLEVLESSNPSPSHTEKETSEQDSPTAFNLSKDGDLANGKAHVDGDRQEDEPSAADYDPTMDMQEEKMRHHQRQHAHEISSSSYDETKATKQDVLLPDAIVDKSMLKKIKDEFDMFADEEDEETLAVEPATSKPKNTEEHIAKAIAVPQAKALDMSMLDDWDDDQGYYKVILGELLEGRYHVQSNLGKGMFSGVVRAMDQRTKKLVAIKLIRSNETMKKAGLKEIDILQTLAKADPEDKKHMIRLERYFEHKGHLCMVFENLSINLREVLKKFGRDVGINLKAVRAYAQQMFLGLSLLKKCNILHADLKPDNVLVNESRNVLKICDLGSASDASENEITEYLVSRFYRAPEIMLGTPYDFAIDIWSVGCTLFELYTGKILFTGRDNNQMLRSIMECRGKFSHKLLRKAQLAGRHFDDLLNFRSVELDKLSGKDTIRILTFTKPTRDLRTRLLANAKGMNDADAKELNLFIDLLDRCLNLNPEKRCTPMEALKHPFITRVGVGKM